MPQGKHKGVRVVLTVDQERYEEWKRLSGAAEMPVATMMRESLDMILPSLIEVHDLVHKHKEEPEVMEEMMGRILWRTIKGGIR
jgi:hypothetical protein